MPNKDIDSSVRDYLRPSYFDIRYDFIFLLFTEMDDTKEIRDLRSFKNRHFSLDYLLRHLLERI